LPLSPPTERKKFGTRLALYENVRCSAPVAGWRLSRTGHGQMTNDKTVMIEWIEKQSSWWMMMTRPDRA
jgi:hypothetical protein